MPELLPKKVLDKYEFVDIKSALSNIHRPDKSTSHEDLISSNNKNKQRLVFEELLAHQLIFKEFDLLTKP